MPASKGYPESQERYRGAVCGLLLEGVDSGLYSVALVYRLFPSSEERLEERLEMGGCRSTTLVMLQTSWIHTLLGITEGITYKSRAACRWWEGGGKGRRDSREIWGRGGGGGTERRQIPPVMETFDIETR